MKRVGFERLAFIFARNAMKRTRSGDIDHDRQNNDEETPEVYFDLDLMVNEALNSFVDDPETGDEKEHRLDERRKALNFAVSVQVSFVGRPCREFHRKVRDDRRKQIKS